MLQQADDMGGNQSMDAVDRPGDLLQCSLHTSTDVFERCPGDLIEQIFFGRDVVVERGLLHKIRDLADRCAKYPLRVKRVEAASSNLVCISLTGIAMDPGLGSKDSFVTVQKTCRLAFSDHLIPCPVSRIICLNLIVRWVSDLASLLPISMLLQDSSDQDPTKSEQSETSPLRSW